MRKFDTLQKIKIANILAEQRYRMRLKESTESDLIDTVIQKINDFSTDDGSFDDYEFKIVLQNDRINSFVNGVNVELIEILASGKYKMTSRGYYSPGRYSGPPEDSYPDESEAPEFDIMINEIKISGYDNDDNEMLIGEMMGGDVQRMPKEFLQSIEEKVYEMLLDSGKFDSSSRFDDYNDYD